MKSIKLIAILIGLLIIIGNFYKNSSIKTFDQEKNQSDCINYFNQLLYGSWSPSISEDSSSPIITLKEDKSFILKSLDLNQDIEGKWEFDQLKKQLNSLLTMTIPFYIKNGTKLVSPIILKIIFCHTQKVMIFLW